MNQRHTCMVCSQCACQRAVRISVYQYSLGPNLLNLFGHATDHIRQPQAAALLGRTYPRVWWRNVQFNQKIHPHVVIDMLSGMDQPLGQTSP